MVSITHNCTENTVTIICDDTDEVLAIKDGLADPSVLAFVKVHGVLAQLPDDRARVRVLRYVGDLISDPSYTPQAKQKKGKG